MPARRSALGHAAPVPAALPLPLFLLALAVAVFRGPRGADAVGAPPSAVSPTARRGLPWAESVPRFDLPPQLDAAALRAAEAEAVKESDGRRPLRYGLELPANGTDLFQAGGWVFYNGSTAEWNRTSHAAGQDDVDVNLGAPPLLRLLVRSPGAIALTVRMANASLCGGAVFATAVDSAGGAMLGDPAVRTMADADAPPAGAILTETIGDEVLLEYVRGPRAAHAGCVPSLELFDVVHHFDTELGNVSLPSARVCESAECQVDITCDEGDSWEEMSRGVFKLIVGGSVCSASLIRDPEGEGRLLALTADHCVDGFSGGSPFWLAQFGLERECSAGCPLTGVTSQGIDVLWHNGNPDLALIQLQGGLPKSADPYYNGFDTSTSVSGAEVDQGVTTIHHPRGDYKKLSRRAAGATRSFAGNLWQVFPGWDFGTVQGGSSGGPLFADSSRRVVGVTSTVDSCTFSNPCGGCSASIFNYGSLGYAWDIPSASSGAPLWSLISPSEQFLDGIDGSDNNDADGDGEAGSDDGATGADDDSSYFDYYPGGDPDDGGDSEPEPCKGDMDCVGFCVGKGGKAPKPDDDVCDDGWGNPDSLFANFLCAAFEEDGAVCGASAQILDDDDAGGADVAESDGTDDYAPAEEDALVPRPVAFFPLNDGLTARQTSVRDTLGGPSGQVFFLGSPVAPDDIDSQAWVEDEELGMVLSCGGVLDGATADTYAELPDVEYGSSGAWAISMMLRTQEPEEGVDPVLNPFAYFFSHGELDPSDVMVNVFQPNHINVLSKRTDLGQLEGVRVVARSKSDLLDQTRFMDSDTSFHAALSDNDWHHVILTSIGQDNSADGLAGHDLYVDGELVAVERLFGQGPIDPSGPVTLCARADLSVERVFTGRMARVAFFDQEISAEQAAALADLGGAGQQPQAATATDKKNDG